MTKPLKIAINAQLVPGGGAGGVEQFVMGLIHGLGQLDDGPEEYTVVSSWQELDWLNPYLGPNQRIVSSPRPESVRVLQAVKRLLGPLGGPVGAMWRRVRRVILGLHKPPAPVVPVSDGFYESLGVDLVHFPYQRFVRCSLPTIYNPHDLQHLHYPQFFTPQEIARRETVYRAGCRYSQAVAVQSNWTKDDIIRQYGVAPNKIQVIHRGSPTDLYEPVTSKNLTAVRQKFRLPHTFALYPAQTWPHKNHIRLVEAIKLLKEQHDLSLDLVCTGRQNDFWPTLEKHIGELALRDQVRFLGFVSPTELRALYRLAQFVVFPSLFEGAGLPILEGFREGTPVACSAVTALPEYGGDAVLLFDPTSVESIAEAMLRMATDAELRATLRQRGAARIRLFTWERAAKAYRALYRRVAGRPLSDEDRHLLTNGSARRKPLDGNDVEAVPCTAQP